MKPLRNLTLHLQGEAEKAIAAASGFDLSTAPEGVLVEPDESGLQQAAQELVHKLRQCATNSEAVLVGGHTGALLAAVMTLVSAGEALPEFYYFDTRRVRDSNGRFVFVPERLVRVLPL